METPKLQFFLSGVSADFGVPDDAGGDRRFLCDRVTSPAVAVKVQEQFDDLGEPMLLALDTYIASCDAVFHLIGDHTGSTPPPAVVRQLLERHPDLGTSNRTAFLDDGLEKDDAGITYTQWEAYLALYHDKKLFRFRPTGAYLKPAPESQREAQARHVARLKAATLHPTPVANRDQLWALMEKALAQWYWTRGVPQPWHPTRWTSSGGSCAPSSTRCPRCFAATADGCSPTSS